MFLMSLSLNSTNVQNVQIYVPLSLKRCSAHLVLNPKWRQMNAVVLIRILLCFYTGQERNRNAFSCLRFLIAKSLNGLTLHIQDPVNSGLHFIFYWPLPCEFQNQNKEPVKERILWMCCSNAAASYSSTSYLLAPWFCNELIRSL